MPTPSSVSYSPGLTKIALAYSNKQYVCDRVLPHMPVDGKTGRYKSLDVEGEYDVEGGFIGPTGQADEIDFTVSETAFALDDYGKKGWVSQQTIDNAEAPIRPLETMTRRVTERVLRKRERIVAQAVLNTSNYAAGNQLDAGGLWLTTTTDIWGQMLTGLDACAAPPNVGVMDIATFRAVQRNEKILAAIKGTLAPQFVEQAKGPGKTGAVGISDAVVCKALSDALGLDNIYIGAAWYKTSKKGQAFTKARIWDLPNATKGGCAFLRVAKDQTEDVIWGANLFWKQPLRVMTWFDPDRGADGSTAVKVVETMKIQLMANDAGYLFRDTLLT